MSQRDDVESKPGAEAAPTIAPSSDAAQPAAAGRTTSRHMELLSQLGRLLPAQFKKVVFLVGIPPEYLPERESQTERAIDLLRYSEQQKQIDQLDQIVQQVVTGHGRPPSEDDRGRSRHFVLGFAVLVVAPVTAVMIAHGLPGDTPQPPIDVSDRVAPGPVILPGPQPGGLVRGCPPDMAPVPAGRFQMGSPKGIGDTDEHPQHDVTLSAYCIDRTEVTVKAYADCVRAGWCSAATLTVQWTGLPADDRERFSQLCNGENRSEHPINCVDWNQATVYCAWVGKELPSEAEWEYAARGGDGRLYPWGGKDEPSPTRLNGCGRECVAKAKQLGLDWAPTYDATDAWVSTAPVGSFPAGASPFGALDMAGNVSEWTADWYGTYPAAAVTNPRGPQSGNARMVRGGAWDSPGAGRVQATDRSYRYEVLSRHNQVGFRCVRRS